MVGHRTVIAIKLLIYAVIAGSWFAMWLQAPVLSTIDVRSWRWIGFVSAVAIGSLGTAVIGKWLPVSVAAAIGLLAGATLAEALLPNDIEQGMLDSVRNAVRNLWPDLARFVVGAIVGGLLLSLPRVVLFLKQFPFRFRF